MLGRKSTERCGGEGESEKGRHTEDLGGCLQKGLSKKDDGEWSPEDEIKAVRRTRRSLPDRGPGRTKGLEARKVSCSRNRKEARMAAVKCPGMTEAQDRLQRGVGARWCRMCMPWEGIRVLF